MVRTDGIDDAVVQAGADRFAVALAAKRRRHARVRIEKADVGVGHVDVVSADVAGDRQAFLFGRAHQLDASRRRHAAQVDAGAGGAHQLENRVQRDRLGHHRHAGQAEARSERAGVGDAAAADVRILRAQPHGVFERFRILQRAQQHVGVFDRLFSLRKADAASFSQFRHLGQGAALQAHRQRAERMHVGLVQAARAVLEHLHQARFVQHRVGVGRADQAGHAALHRRLHFGLQRGLVFVAGFAQPGRQIDQPGRDHQAGGVDGAIGNEAGRRRAGRRNHAVNDEHVAQRIDVVFRVDQTPVLDMQFHPWVPANMLMTAIRTAMPNVTCGRITACAPSATAESISTPRFIGPGCITIASGLASASRSGVRP